MSDVPAVVSAKIKWEENKKWSVDDKLQYRNNNVTVTCDDVVS